MSSIGGDSSSGGAASPLTARSMRLERVAQALAHSQEELRRYAKSIQFINLPLNTFSQFSSIFEMPSACLVAFYYILLSIHTINKRIQFIRNISLVHLFFLIYIQFALKICYKHLLVMRKVAHLNRIQWLNIHNKSLVKSFVFYFNTAALMRVLDAILYKNDNKLLLNTHILPLWHRRSMGLPPAQGHNNLRLINNANLYKNHNHRLDKTQFNTIKTHHKHFMPMPQLRPSSRPFTSSKKHLSTVPMPTSILKPSRYQSSRSKNVEHHVQFELNRSLFSQRQTPYSYSHRNISPNSFGNYQNNYYPKKVRLKVPQLSLSQLKERRSNSSRLRPRKTTILSNMPLINVNSSVVMVNHSPFGLRDPRFGIFHHCSQSISYFWFKKNLFLKTFSRVFLAKHLLPSS